MDVEVENSFFQALEYLDLGLFGWEKLKPGDSALFTIDENSVTYFRGVSLRS